MMQLNRLEDKVNPIHRLANNNKKNLAALEGMPSDMRTAKKDIEVLFEK